jgi:hypothetical protein
MAARRRNWILILALIVAAAFLLHRILQLARP